MVPCCTGMLWRICGVVGERRAIIGCLNGVFTARTLIWSFLERACDGCTAGLAVRVMICINYKHCEYSPTLFIKYILR